MFIYGEPLCLGRILRNKLRKFGYAIFKTGAFL